MDKFPAIAKINSWVHSGKDLSCLEKRRNDADILTKFQRVEIFGTNYLSEEQEGGWRQSSHRKQVFPS